MKQVHFLALLFFLWVPVPAFPQASAGSAASHPSQAMAPPTTSYTLPPDELRKSKALYMLRGTLLIAGFAYSLAVFLAILFFGIAARYRDWAESVSSRRFVQALVVVPLLLLTIDLLQLPLDAYAHHMNLQYGLSVQSWESWFLDFLKEEALTVAAGIPLLWMLVSVIRRSPRRWWLYFWLAAMPILLSVVLIKPVVIDPLFNKFEPLEATHPELVEAIERVVQHGGLSIPRDRMYEMKASEKVTVLNAYVTGFGPSKRVVVWDTTIQKLTIPETLFVFGHEMGHYVLHHIVYGLIGGALGLLLALYLLYRAAGWTLAHFGQKWHIRDLGDWAALPMLFLLFGVLGFISDPVTSTVSRYIEHQADVYGLEVTHGINANSREVAAHSFQAMGELSLDYPYPSKLVVIWFYDHPPTSDRVRFAHDYDPWSKAEPPKYVK